MSMFVVSIPFIAGQWSLRGGKEEEMEAIFVFQSPSLRGSGRFPRSPHGGRRRARRVSIPFIAGQWSLHFARPLAARRGGKFQSPSLRGSGRFRERAEKLREELTAFQSPSLRGSGRFGLSPSMEVTTSSQVSIPFIAGQWSLPPHPAARRGGKEKFQSPSLRGSGRFGTLFTTRRCIG